MTAAREARGRGEIPRRALRYGRTCASSLVRDDAARDGLPPFGDVALLSGPCGVAGGFGERRARRFRLAARFSQRPEAVTPSARIALLRSSAILCARAREGAERCCLRGGGCGGRGGGRRSELLTQALHVVSILSQRVRGVPAAAPAKR
jgi:hypothetical protein